MIQVPCVSNGYSFWTWYLDGSAAHFGSIAWKLNYRYAAHHEKLFAKFHWLDPFSIF